MNIQQYHLLESWVSGLDAKASILILKILKILKTERDQIGEDVIITPIKAFQEEEIDKVTYESILFNLDSHGIINAVETRSTSPSSKMPFSVSGIAENIRIIKPLFDYVFDLLQVKIRDSAEKPQNLYPLKLVLSGNQLLIQGYAIPSSVKLVEHQLEGSGLLLNPIFKACRARPSEWHKLTKARINTCVKYEDIELQKGVSHALENPAQFRKYLSKIGLKNPINKLFIRRASGGLGIKFRLIVPDEEWQDLSGIEREKVVKFISERASSK